MLTWGRPVSLRHKACRTAKRPGCAISITVVPLFGSEDAAVLAARLTMPTSEPTRRNIAVLQLNQTIEIECA